MARTLYGPDGKPVPFRPAGSVGGMQAGTYASGINPATGGLEPGYSWDTSGGPPTPGFSATGSDGKPKLGPGPMKRPSSDTVSSAQDASDQFQNNLPQYLGSQYAAAGDKARENLAQDIQNTKASYNSRGLLYSGLEGGSEATDKAQESSALAGNIQDINTQAQTQGEQLEQNAVDQARQTALYDTQTQSLQASAAQTAYEQALGEQQSMNDFYAGLASGIGQFGGGVAAYFAQGNS